MELMNTFQVQPQRPECVFFPEELELLISESDNWQFYWSCN